MFDLTDFCRICARADCTLTDIYKEDSDTVKFSEKLTFCIADAIVEDDVLPNLICDTCCNNLRTSYSFKKVCLKTRKLFNEINKDDVENEKPFVSTAKFIIKEEDISDHCSSELIIKEEYIGEDEDGMYMEIKEFCALCGGEFNDLTEVNSKKICNNCKHECVKCSEIFSSFEDLQNHYKEQHFSQIKSENDEETLTTDFICSICNFHYPNERLLMVHMRNHSGEQPYQCNICKERFSWQHHLQRHKQKCRPGRAFPCTVCRNKFLNVAQLKMHMRQHARKSADEEERLKKMEEEYEKKKQAEEQLRQVEPFQKHEQLYFSCSICKKSFSNRHKLIIHFRSHSGEKPYKCKVCGKCFSQSGYLRYHERIHTGERPFKCKICGSSFTQKTTLVTHMRVHEQKKKVKCRVCKKTFMYSCTLRRHLKHMHQENYGKAVETRKADIVLKKFNMV